MDAITGNISSLWQFCDIRRFIDELENQQQYLRAIRNLSAKHACDLREIHKMEDESALATLIQLYEKHYNENSDALYFQLRLQDIGHIKNAYKSPNAHNVRPFYEHEINLLNTLHIITSGVVTKHVGQRTIILNAITCKIEFNVEFEGEGRGYFFGENNYANIADFHTWDISMQNSHAFGAKMTTNEYKDFICNLTSSISLCNKIFSSWTHYSSHCNLFTSVNIADLLLCAINEQYPKNITFVEMNIADRVFYDTYLLKCITSVKFL